MSGNDIPLDIAVLVLSYLMDDPKGFVNLSSTCKTFLKAAELIVGSPLWIEKRPLAFKLSLVKDYNPHNPSNTEGRFQAERECRPPRKDGSPEDGVFSSQIYVPHDCYYHRLYCLTQAKYRRFSTLKFEKYSLFYCHCFIAFKDAIAANRSLAQPRINAVVELNFSDCKIDLRWLSLAIDALPNLSYLTLDEVFVEDPSDVGLNKPKTLKRLTIGDQYNKFSDFIFLFFLSFLPAEELDLRAAKVECHERIIRRFYTDLPPDIHSSDIYLNRPAENLFTFPIIVKYLTRHSSIVKHLYASSSMDTPGIALLLRHPDLTKLKISVRGSGLAYRKDLVKKFKMNENQLSRLAYYGSRIPSI